MPRAPSLLAIVALLAMLVGLSPAVASPSSGGAAAAERAREGPPSASSGTSGEPGSASKSKPATRPTSASEPTSKSTPASESTPASDPASGADVPKSDTEDPAAPAVDPLRRRASQIRALIDGTLDLGVDPSSLLVIDLANHVLVGPGGERLRTLLIELDAPPEPPPARKPRRGRSREPEPPPPDPATELADALEAYLRLTPEEREAAWLTHARRQADAVAEREASSRREARYVVVSQHADQLEAFLAGTLDIKVDPRPLLLVDLADAHEAALSPSRRQAWSTPAETGDVSGADAPEPGAGPSGTSPDAPAPTPTGEPPGSGKPSASGEPSSSGDPTSGEPTTSGEPPSTDEPPSSDAPPSNGAPQTPRDEVPTSDPEALARAEARLDALRRRFLALSPSEQAGLFELHERRAREAEAAAKAEAEAEKIAKAEAEAEATVLLEETKAGEEAAAEISSAEAEAQAAAAERDEALEEARLARTEATRILAKERARLLEIKKEQALFEAELKRQGVLALGDLALEWSGRVSKLHEGEAYGDDVEAEADRLYPSIRVDLAKTRAMLEEELLRIRNPGGQIPRVGEGLDSNLTDDFDRGEIGELREHLRDRERELLDLEQEIAWKRARDLRDDVETLNDTRLNLLSMASSDLRDRVTGFGADGLDQVRSELDQISVVLGFHALKLPRYGDILLELLRDSPIEVVGGVVQLLLVMLGLWWWRRRWPGLLRRLRLLIARRRPMTRLAKNSLSGLWYLDHIRSPLELLLSLWVALNLVGGLDDFDELPELVLLWIIVSWILVGLAVILLLDAIAARDTMARHRGRADSSPLRIHSLRVVGVNVITVGLILSLTSELVGHGAIYSWVISTCWLLSVPVALYLVHRWRPIIIERLAQHPEQGAFVTWARERQTGWIRFVAATASAGYLFAYGLGRWLMRQLGGRETTRRVLAYLFRREVAKRAAATAAVQKSLTRVDPTCYSTFDPEHYERKPIETVGQAELDKVAALVEVPRSTLSAVIGERGRGKTSFLRRLEQRLGTDRIKVVSCPEIGLDGLMQRIAAIAGDRDARGPELAEALRRMGPLTIAIDDAQRLIQPAIRGLRELDRLTAFAREVGGEISWVITMGSAAWHYLKRARGNRVFFEQELELPRWTEEQLGSLIRARCAAAGIEPSFEGLVVPRPVDALTSPDEHRTEAGYYRLLWDFSWGNPAVALHAFRESLFVGPDDQIVVRLFKEPPAKEIESLPLPLMFVLRAVVQLDVAREHEIIAATQLPPSDVSDALRFCLTRGYVERYDAGVRITWPWFRTITIVLLRQHLLSAP